MAHYAFINENNIVTDVIVGKDEDDTTDLPEGFDSWEDWYADFRGETCKRTSYNTVANTHTDGGTPFRGNYAGIGMTYDADNDVFYGEKPFYSWTISADTNWVWEAPIPYPDDGNVYIWNENAYQGDNTQGWELYNE
tara:strand:- start:293 stop:703 length:411 start_codon:yes stop_codon:yes gene_type:complete